jgi:hypothetical protein
MIFDFGFRIFDCRPPVLAIGNQKSEIENVNDVLAHS